MINRKAHVARLITNIALFQVGWFVCLLGGSLWALLFTATALVIHAKFIQHSLKEWRLLAGFAAAGIIWDGLLMSTGLIQFSPPQDTLMIAGYFTIIPAWLICLWVLFAITVNHSLYWLAPYPWLAALLTAFFAPVSYYAGVQLSEAQLSQPYWQPLLAVACGWGLAFPVALRFCKRYCRPTNEPVYE